MTTHIFIWHKLCLNTLSYCEDMAPVTLPKMDLKWHSKTRKEPTAVGTGLCTVYISFWWHIIINMYIRTILFCHGSGYWYVV